MILLFRSFKIALISMISNVIPIFLTLAMMSLSDIPLDISTVVIGPIAMGIVVDDTIHFIFCYLRLRRQGNSITETLNETLSIVGKPITFTSITLGLCFGILAFSHFLPIIYFGKLTALTMGFAWVAVLILLPALLTLFESPFARRGRLAGGSLGFSEE